jgi:hypothetical protein
MQTASMEKIMATVSTEKDYIRELKQFAHMQPPGKVNFFGRVLSVMGYNVMDIKGRREYRFTLEDNNVIKLSEPITHTQKNIEFLNEMCKSNKPIRFFGQNLFVQEGRVTFQGLSRTRPGCYAQVHEFLLSNGSKIVIEGDA